MLEQVFKFEPGNMKASYDLDLIRDTNQSRKTKLLVILQTVDRRDLEEGELLSKDVKKAFVNCLDYAKKYARRVNPAADLNFSLTVVNFNAYKHLHLSTQKKRLAVQEFAERMRKLIKITKPTKILVSGDEAFKALFPKVVAGSSKRGWVHDLELDDQKFQVTSTLDFSRLLEQQGLRANLLGYWCRHTANLLLGKNPYQVSQEDAKPVYVDTIKKFKQVLKLMYSAPRIAVDTETRNLSVLSNRLYIAQMAFDTDKERDNGYVIPIDHPQTPFTVEERKFIKKHLRVFFSGDRQYFKEGQEFPELVFFNGMFDLRVIRQQLRIQHMPQTVYEITFAEHLLDENINELSKMGIKAGSLRAYYTAYGNDFYWLAKFGKEDRGSIGSMAPNDPGVLMYCATDVVALLRIRNAQVKRSSHEVILGKPYTATFLRHMKYQMSDTAHELSRLRQDGSFVDVSYLKELASPKSPLRIELDELGEKIANYPATKAVNAELLKESGLKAKSLLGRSDNRRVFRLGKPAHRLRLFLDAMGLESVSQTQKGEPAIDKVFIEHYRNKYSEVDTFGQYSDISKLHAGYIRSWLKKMRTSKDAATDSSLRPDYNVIDTGRLASRNPSLQVIPTRKKVAKIVKEMFPAPEGYLSIRFDYSAHEVRVWAVVSGDEVLASQFKIGQALRQKYIADPSEENKQAIKLKGDLHILNVKRFWGKQVDKDHPLRDAVKAVVFGAIYGKSAQTLGEDTKLTDIKTVEKEIIEVTAKKEAGWEKKIKQLEQKLKDIREEDRTEYAEGILSKLFAEFKAGGRWLKKMERMAAEDCYVYSPIGRIRHLYAALTGDMTVVNRQVRRGVNAPIQGFASEIGTKAARLIETTYNEELPKMCEFQKIEQKTVLPLKINRMVHDASYFAVPYSMVIPFIHQLQYQATYGIANQYKKEFGVKFSIEPEIEIECAGIDSESHKIDWSLPSFVSSIDKAVLKIAELGRLPKGRTHTDVMDEILKPWKSKTQRQYLQDKFPLLGVKDLDSQIRGAVGSYIKARSEPVKEAA